MESPSPTAEPSPEVLRLRAAGDERRVVLAALFEEHRPRLLRMVRMRMHPLVRARLDPDDVLQEAGIEIDRGLDAFLENPRLPFFLWLRLVTGQRLMRAHRMHLQAKQRDVRRQEAGQRRYPNATTAALAERLVAQNTSPTAGAVRNELHTQLHGHLEQLSDTDRNVISLRHFEGLSNEEVALELGLSKHAASKRYIRALERLRAQTGDFMRRNEECGG